MRRMPASNGTKARTTAVKRARNTLATPYLSINALLRLMKRGYRFSGQRKRTFPWYRCPSQNDKPSPTMAPAVAATSRNQGLTSAPAARALIAITSVEPGTTVPITGMASDNASRKTAATAYCGCAPTNSTNPEK